MLLKYFVISAKFQLHVSYRHDSFEKRVTQLNTFFGFTFDSSSTDSVDIRIAVGGLGVKSVQFW